MKRPVVKHVFELVIVFTIFGFMFAIAKQSAIIQSAVKERDEARSAWCNMLKVDGYGPDVKGNWRGALSFEHVRWIRWCLLGPGESGVMTDAEIEEQRRQSEIFHKKMEAEYGW